ncbi:MAG: hypothetical protein L0Y72_30355 [Gemmataceae bacterium]|nr:hypothetical protein [Gemmataceae bacterium]MCI0743350.1 hypothetical protein [Gemmataceae bacterium]
MAGRQRSAVSVASQIRTMSDQRIIDVTDVHDGRGNIYTHFPSQSKGGWIPEGEYYALREDGTLLLKISYRNGVVHGPFVDYWSDGKVASEGQFVNGRQDGLWHFYFEDGRLSEIIHFKDGKEIRAERKLSRRAKHQDNGIGPSDSSLEPPTVP